MKSRSGILTLLLLLALTGCAGPITLSGMASQVNDNHSLIEKETRHYASVYFIRPDTERYMGAADNRLTVELEHEQLLSLVKAEYTLLRLKPGVMDVTIKSHTIAGPFRKFKEMKRTRSFEFEAGATYYISIEPVDGEFRGVYFLPHMVELVAAKEASRFMRAVGPAKEAPLHAAGTNPLIPLIPIL